MYFGTTQRSRLASEQDLESEREKERKWEWNETTSGWIYEARTRRAAARNPNVRLFEEPDYCLNVGIETRNVVTIFSYRCSLLAPIQGEYTAYSCTQYSPTPLVSRLESFSWKYNSYSAMFLSCSLFHVSAFSRYMLTTVYTTRCFAPITISTYVNDYLRETSHRELWMGKILRAGRQPLCYTQ